MNAKAARQAVAREWFSCPKCEERGEPSAHHSSASRVVGGVRYCTICAGELVDVVANDVYTRALKGTVSWWEGKEHMDLRVTFQPRVLTILVKSSQDGLRKLELSTFESFWDCFDAFISNHFNALQALVEPKPEIIEWDDKI